MKAKITAFLCVFMVCLCSIAWAAISADAISVDTDSSGDATAYSGKTYNGVLKAIVYEKDNYANGVDFTITSETTGQTLWTQSDVNASVIKYPLTQACSTAGVAATLNGTQAMLVPIALFNERIKIVIAQGGNATAGDFKFLVEGF